MLMVSKVTNKTVWVKGTHAMKQRMNKIATVLSFFASVKFFASSGSPSWKTMMRGLSSAKVPTPSVGLLMDVGLLGASFSTDSLADGFCIVDVSKFKAVAATTTEGKECMWRERGL